MRDAALDRWPREKLHALSRSITVALVLAAIGTLFWRPEGPLEVAADVLLRTYLMFLCTVMAHDASHGHLGRTKRANLWWGRIALLPVTVPAVSFRKTHYLHHLHTNEPGEDPDHFIKPNHWWEVPLRSLALPHQWVVWLLRRRKLTRADALELLATYLVLAAIYGGVLAVMGGERLFWGMVPPLVLVSHLLWYPFAVMTHEGFSTGEPEARSHNYYGRLAYWLTLGLSMHRDHHLYPARSWIELRAGVEPAPAWAPFRRSVRG